jgi:7,8-dihydroneopterin aldolase/epimerase/oxygenase
MALISLTGMEFFAHHGCSPEEQKKGSNFSIDLEFFTSTETAEITDDLKNTVDYQLVYNLVKEEMAKPSKLLEHVARRIVDTIGQQFPGIGVAKICVSKLKPALGGEVQKVSVTLNKKS